MVQRALAGCGKTLFRVGFAKGTTSEGAEKLGFGRSWEGHDFQWRRSAFGTLDEFFRSLLGPHPDEGWPPAERVRAVSVVGKARLH